VGSLNWGPGELGLKGSGPLGGKFRYEATVRGRDLNTPALGPCHKKNLSNKKLSKKKKEEMNWRNTEGIKEDASVRETNRGNGGKGNPIQKNEKIRQKNEKKGLRRLELHNSVKYKRKGDPNSIRVSFPMELMKLMRGVTGREDRGVNGNPMEP